MNIVIKGTGSYIPGKVIRNSHFNDTSFYDVNGEVILDDTKNIITRFQQITGIKERRYVKSTENLSDIAAVAALRTIQDGKLDPEQIDVIIMAHNFGDVTYGSSQIDILPSIATRVKHALGISNPDCIAFDVICGCPGWIQALILAKQYLLSKEAKQVLIIGGDTLSRVIDPHDRDSMIYADGAAATLMEAIPGEGTRGIIATSSKTYSRNEAFYLHNGRSNEKGGTEKRFLKMNGRKIYEFALTYVPLAMKNCLDKSGKDIAQLKKIFLHQANEKMDEAILKRFFQLYNIDTPPDSIMPMNINKLGNTSVASIPTLFDTVLKNNYPGHTLNNGDVILMASVGAGMNINAVTYVC